LIADYGSYLLTGQDLSFQISRKLTAENVQFTLSGQLASLLASRKLSSDYGAFTLTGQDATLSRTRSLLADAGYYTLTGQDADLLFVLVYVAVSLGSLPSRSLANSLFTRSTSVTLPNRDGVGFILDDRDGSFVLETRKELLND
jgi:hypothetical protein